MFGCRLRVSWIVFHVSLFFWDGLGECFLQVGGGGRLGCFCFGLGIFCYGSGGCLVFVVLRMGDGICVGRVMLFGGLVDGVLTARGCLDVGGWVSKDWGHVVWESADAVLFEDDVLGQNYGG